MDTLKSIQVFQTVASSRSFSAAAASLNITPAMATRYVKHIENHIGARLLNRTSRKVSLTEAGAMYLAQIAPLLEGLEEASALATDSTRAPKGVLKVLMPAMMSTPIFSRLIADFRTVYPEVTLHFDFAKYSGAFVDDTYDLTLHLGEVAAEGMVARKLADVHFCLVARPSLLEDYSRPTQLSELENLPFIAHPRFCSANKLKWKSAAGNRDTKITPVLVSDNDMMILHTALEGVGATILPDWLVISYVQQGRLEVALPGQVDATLPLYALYQDRSFLPAKTRAFIDFMAAYRAKNISAFNLN